MPNGDDKVKPGKTGKKHEAVVPAKKLIKGRLMYKRDWDYESGPGGPEVEMPMPQVEIEFHGAEKDGGPIKKRGTFYTDDDGNWEYKTLAWHDASIRVNLEHKGGKIVAIYGYQDESDLDSYFVQKNQIVGGKIDLDGDLLKEEKETIELEDVEITDAKFRSVCDVYSSIVFGHKQLKSKASYDTPLAKIYFPYPPSEGVSCASGGKLFIAELDAQDRSVLLHEWGHFLIDALLGSYTKDSSWPGGALYDYQTTGTAPDKSNHGPTTKEYLQSAWNEGVASFFSCALSESAIYHDDYDSNLTMDLENDLTTVGPHCEGSIQGALWHFLESDGVDFKADFWKVLTSTKKRKVRTIWAFLDNYKDAGGSNLDKLLDALSQHGIDYRYDCLPDKYENISASGDLDTKKKKFPTVNSLYDEFGTVDSGPEDLYDEEFFNSNNKFNSGKLDAGSTYDDPKVKVGNKYLVPVRSAAG